MELGEKAASFEAKGYRVAAITYDSPAIVKAFAERKNLRYPLMGDAGSSVIRAFGILNESIQADSPFFGVPHPGTYRINPKGTVEAKHFERDYRERFTAGGILVRDFGEGGVTGQESSTRHLTVRAAASNTAVYPGSRLMLTLDVELKPGLHVYAPGVQGEYIAVEWKLAESKAWMNFDAVWPKSRRKHLKAIRESVPVYEKKFRVMRDLKMAQARELYPAAVDGKIAIEGEFRYQACDAKVCYPPETVPLKWILEARPQDRERAPTDLRKVK